jgi:phosphatidylglycerol---prolipoprotein diacylglyceryl transferase
MFPYLTINPFSFGPFIFGPFETVVTIGVFFGSTAIWKGGIKLGLGNDLLQNLIFWSLLSGFIGSHIFETVVYHPYRLLENPMMLLTDWREMSAFGMFYGGAICFLVFRKLFEFDTWLCADNLIYGVNIARIFGRFGCYLVHDHPGILTNSIFGVQYPGGSRFDLGLLEMFFLIFLHVFFLKMNKMAFSEGTLTISFAFLYGLFRFFSDFLRVADITYLGLTPGQYSGLVFIFWGTFYLFKRRKFIKS